MDALHRINLFITNLAKLAKFSFIFNFLSNFTSQCDTIQMTNIMKKV